MNSIKNFDIENSQSSIKGDSLDYNSLFEFSKLLNSSLDSNFILDHILLSSMGKMLITKGCVLLTKGENTYSIQSVKGISTNYIGKEFDIPDFPNDIFYFESNKDNGPWISELINLNFKIGIPVLLKEKKLAIICFSEKLTRSAFTNSDFYFLQILSNIASTSIENSLIVQDLVKLNKDLDKKIQQLNTLFDLGKEFGMLFENDKIIRLLSYSLMGQMGIQKYAILLKDESDLKISNSRINNLENLFIDFNRLLNIDHPVILKKIENDDLIFKQLSDLNIKAVVPIKSKNEIKGSILLSTKIDKEEYSQSDLEFVYSLGNLAMLSIENARLFKETLEKQKLEEEIQIAREIQQGLLPKKLPIINRFDSATFNIASKQVGGDYFDIIKKNENIFIFTIADVSGKGIPASLLMSNLQATIHAYAPMVYSLSEATGKINDIIFENTDMSKFITFFWGTLDTSDNTFNYVNAGHNPPILMHQDGEVEYLTEGGVILGVMSTLVPYKEAKIQISKGDLLFFYTDGVTESMNSDHIEFGEEYLLNLLQKYRSLSCEEILKALYEDIKNHAAGCPQYDDITIIALKMLE